MDVDAEAEAKTFWMHGFVHEEWDISQGFLNISPVKGCRKGATVSSAC